MKSNLISFICGLLMASILMYLGIVVGLNKKIESLNDESDDALIRNFGWKLYIGVCIRESHYKEVEDSVDKHLYFIIKLLNKKFSDRASAKYLLWRIKKYSKDFSIQFPKDAKEILNNIPDERPDYPEKIGEE